MPWLFGGNGYYQYSARESLQAIRAYAQSEAPNSGAGIVRLSVSNIAWDIDEDEQVSLLLARAGIDAIDIAPGKYFPDPAKAGDADIAGVRRWWSDKGIEITGMQALLFGTTGLNVFGSRDVQRNLLDHLAAVSHIGAGLGATRLVFGSPKNRDRSGLDDQRVPWMLACRSFGNLALSLNCTG